MFFQEMYVFLLPQFNKRVILFCHTFLAAPAATCQTMSTAAPSPYAVMIANATGAPGRDCVLIEEIMRTEVFHSTLDWQSPAEFAIGARKAWRILQSNRPYFALSQKQARLFFKEMQVRQQMRKAETALSRAKARGDTARSESARKQVEKATQRLNDLNRQLQILSGFLERLSGTATATPSAIIPPPRPL